MKIYLSSYKEIENHGNGNKISIASSKPDNINTFLFEYFIPNEETLNSYNENKFVSLEKAAEEFNKNYSKQLDSFYYMVLKESENTGKHIFEILPFQDGDTLLSWERSGYSNYRYHVAKCLEKMGYEVNLK